MPDYLYCIDKGLAPEVDGREDMGKPRTIAILFFESARQDEMCKYRIWMCAEVWRKIGFNVLIVQGLETPKNVDMIVPQIDLSVFPDAYRHLLELEIPVLNRRVLDIRKSAFSENLVSWNDDYEGPVIVKTDCNYGGLPELWASARLPWRKRVPARMASLRRACGKALKAKSINRLSRTATMSPADYPVYMAKRGVPRYVFENGDLVVEKFLPERDGDAYCLRSYAFLGDEGIGVRTKASEPVLKGETGTCPEVVPVHPSIIAARAALGFDYGKFDYVVHGGEAVLLDVNVTPTFGSVYTREFRHSITARLAKGITRWFPDREG